MINYDRVQCIVLARAADRKQFLFDDIRKIVEHEGNLFVIRKSNKNKFLLIPISKLRAVKKIIHAHKNNDKSLSFYLLPPGVPE